MTIEILIPTYDTQPSDFGPAPRLADPAGATIGVVSNGKHGTVPFFDALAEELRARYRVAEVVRVVKPSYSAPAGDAILDDGRRWHALVAGIGD